MGHGFIGEPSVEDDYSIKMVGENSFKITSNYEAGSYKEVRFGWVFTDLVSLLGSWGIRYAGWKPDMIGSYSDGAIPLSDLIEEGVNTNPLIGSYGDRA
ncbi:unnamed protein product [marine sediment metagenome]|uniref:Uncharacterized protein n=1 Tax=marine sediment metagenome TaxID=412755 RepID=X0YDM5_9ZZZZ